MDESDGMGRAFEFGGRFNFFAWIGHFRMYLRYTQASKGVKILGHIRVSRGTGKGPTRVSFGGFGKKLKQKKNSAKGIILKTQENFRKKLKGDVIVI